MADPLVLYSTYSWLGYKINETSYRDQHYVWCTPHFDPRSRFAKESAVPPTSSPREIYDILYEECKRRDRHSPKIDQNRLGILRGADVKKRLGVVSTTQHEEISAIVTSAELGDFHPLLLVIPYAPVAAIIKQVPIKDRAHPLSQEYIVENLPRAYFDVLEIR